MSEGLVLSSLILILLSVLLKKSSSAPGPAVNQMSCFPMGGSHTYMYILLLALYPIHIFLTTFS